MCPGGDKFGREPCPLYPCFPVPETGDDKDKVIVPSTAISVSTAIKDIDSLDGSTVEIFGFVTERPILFYTAVCTEKLETIPEYVTKNVKYVFREFRNAPCSGGAGGICIQQVLVFDLAIGDPEASFTGILKTQDDPTSITQTITTSSPYRYAPTEFELGEKVVLTGKLEKTTVSARDCQSRIPSAVFVVDRAQWGKETIQGTLLSLFG